jgi:hypothetical protein
LCLPLLLQAAMPCFAQDYHEEPQVRIAAAPPPGLRGRSLNLPDISVVGVLNGHLSDDKTDSTRDKFEFDEVEVAFQGFIYPKLRADVFLAIHKEGTKYEAEICEAKASYLGVVDGLTAEAGKIHINFGKLNKVHTHQRPMADQPKALTDFFGEHSLTGQGGTLSYLPPLPFYLQAEAGVWQAPAHEHEASGKAEVANLSGNTVEAAVYTESTDFSLSGPLYTGRLKTSLALTSKSELEFGASLAGGHGSHYKEHLDRAIVSGLDLTFRAWTGPESRWTFQNEWFRLSRKVPDGNLERDGFYSFLNYRLDKQIDLGGRFDYSEGAMPAKSIERAFAAIASYHFLETNAVRLQYKVRGMEAKTAHEGWLQFVFGLGPHTHELE